eukprot:TRINITY_DN3395_c0_g1_i1.p1 TRINITY_DN3395_c0_g1~~TRINITY_DN3395_c0_g1_i1.p1  ORF type:complete len:335 (+),score=63.12 TRINITY_DN3395_c0_g1_i1:189-1193(+)
MCIRDSQMACMWDELRFLGSVCASCLVVSSASWALMPHLQSAALQRVHTVLQVASCVAMQMQIALRPSAPLIGVAASFFAVATCMKSLSAASNAEQAARQPYLEYLQFGCSPVLVHRHYLPRNAGIRWRKIGIKVVQNLLYVLVILLVYSSQIADAISNNQRTAVGVYVELAVPGFYCWVLGFLATFDCGLFVMSELFGPARNLRWYGDWWNATTLSEFWCKWNLTVHDYCHYHIYLPLQRHRAIALTTVFFISGFLHWLVYAVAFKTLNPFMGFAMLLQAPLVLVSQRLDGTAWGNLVMWINFVFGITWAGQVYLTRWYQDHDSIMCGALRLK